NDATIAFPESSVSARSVTDPGPRRSRKRRALLALAVSGGGLCLVVILLLVVLQSPAVRSFALSRLSRYLAAQQIDLQVEELRYDLFRLSVEVRNLRVRSGAAPDLPVFASIGHARADLSLADLLRGRYVVDSA